MPPVLGARYLPFRLSFIQSFFLARSPEILPEILHLFFQSILKVCHLS
jgi:hypothetical protein